MVFITGINGFVGENLKSYLKNDFSVCGISRVIKTTDISYKTYFEGNLKYNSLIHLAGKAHDLKNTSNDDEYYEVNFELTKKLYNHFLLSDAKHFVFVSSVKAVADSVVGVLTEESKSNPITIYGKSKRMAEEYILNNLPNDKKVYILRPCMIHGPGNKGNLNLLFDLVRKGIPWPLGAFKNQRSFCSIENLCFVIKELLENEFIPSGIYNIADDKSLSTNDLIGFIAETQNKKTIILNLSKIFIRGVAKIGGVLNLPLNTERLGKLTESYVVSNSKIKNAIKKPFPVNCKEGMLKTLNSFSDYKV
jgi:nucleoside-diphosphate-sugar epimerase